ncbi:MAG TPA: Lrp/AsnC family transcriptional regulator [Aliiroseovarius sp.]|nr:Lrp/AsnC family transcriptional regulator [Aliiroseovarius sp.]
MPQLDEKDRRLIALLKQDSRVSVTVLAAKLSVSRATVQHRLERLLQNGTITRFTIEVADAQPGTNIKAIMMVEIEGPLERSIISNLRRIPEITNTYATNGKWDLVVVVEAANLAEFDRILREIRQIRGVRNSETSILLTSL